LAPSFRSLLLEELSEWLPEDALAPLASALDAPPLSFADRGLRGLLPVGLEATGLPEAGDAVRALPGLLGPDAARGSMFGLEKIARAHAAPESLVRAAHGVCACALSLSLNEAGGPEPMQRAQAQLVSVLVRLVKTSAKASVPVEVAVRCLASDDGVSSPA
jgi:hypothetical protein